VAKVLADRATAWTSWREAARARTAEVDWPTSSRCRSAPWLISDVAEASWVAVVESSRAPEAERSAMVAMAFRSSRS